MVIDEERSRLTRVERLLDLLEYLSSVRITHSFRVADRYGITPGTVFKDLRILEKFLNGPFESRKGAYIKVMDGWWFGRQPLTEEQKTALRLAIREVEDSNTVTLLLPGGAGQRKKSSVPTAAE